MPQQNSMGPELANRPTIEATSPMGDTGPALNPPPRFQLGLVEVLLFGHTDRGRVGDQGLRDDWDSLGAELLRLWIASRPGTRPWAWWNFSRPEPRRKRVDGLLHPFDRPERICEVERLANGNPREQRLAGDAYLLAFGIPAVHIVPDDSTAQYESESSYLIRNGRLTQTELDALATRD